MPTAWTHWKVVTSGGHLFRELHVKGVNRDKAGLWGVNIGVICTTRMQAPSEMSRIPKRRALAKQAELRYIYIAMFANESRKDESTSREKDRKSATNPSPSRAWAILPVVGMQLMAIVQRSQAHVS